MPAISAKKIPVAVEPPLRRPAPEPREQGADSVDRTEVNQLKRSFVQRLERLGLPVTVHSREERAALSACAARFEGEPFVMPCRWSHLGTLPLCPFTAPCSRGLISTQKGVYAYGHSCVGG